MCLVGSVCNGARFITSQTVRFVPVRMVQDSYKDWLSTAEIMKSEEKNDANRRNRTITLDATSVMVLGVSKAISAS